MRKMRLSSPLKSVILLALDHARSRASEHACEHQLVLVNALEKIVSFEHSVQVYECSISRLDTHASEYKIRHTSLRTSLPLYVKARLS
jgi:hypothetical protein